MIPLLTAAQIKQADAYTIAHEPVASIDLMERASKAFVGWFVNRFPNKQQGIGVYCGTGNNGGDGLAIARMLIKHGYAGVSIIIARFSTKSTADFDINQKRLQEAGIKYTELKPGDEIPADDSLVIIDALLGSGINKLLDGDYLRLVNYLNSLQRTVVSVDAPTGLFTDGELPAAMTALHANLVITFQQPKINYLLPESGRFIDCWETVNIGLDEDFIASLNPPYQLVEEADVRQMLQPRKRFSNKGTYGHALLIAGEPETMGAALLCSSACAHTGAGLTTACVPESGLVALNAHQPEVMAIVRTSRELPEIKWNKFNAIGIGPGLGKGHDGRALLSALFQYYDKPVVIDADALNLLAEDPKLMQRIPQGSILTPHMKEFDRLFGGHSSWWHRMQTALAKAKELQVCILLKNDYTMIATPGGQLYFNSTGNPAMASGGMGDVLTGIITALLAQRYTPEQACIMGAYIHGKAGDELAQPNRMHVVLPGRVIAQLPVTMARLGS